MNLQEQLEHHVLIDSGDQSRQSKATRIGFKIQSFAADLFRKNENVDRVEEEVFVEEIDDFSNIDIAVHLKNGKTLYVPVAKDLWLGTSQQDRLQNLHMKHKFGVLENVDYIYMYFSESGFQELMDYEPTHKRARRKLKIKSVVQNLKECGVLGNIDDVWNRINIISKN